MKIEYDTLIQQYNESLHIQLRGFQIGYKFLELWVPDENPTQSLFGMIEAAQLAQIDEPLLVELSPHMADALDLEWLIGATQRWGKLLLSKENKATLLEFQFLRSASRVDKPLKATQPSKINDKVTNITDSDKGITFDLDAVTVTLAFDPSHSYQIHPVYKEAIELASQSLSHEGELDASPHLVVAQSGDTTLAAEMDSNGQVVTAKHQGANSLERVLLDQLCPLLRGRPLQEGQDHATIRLEHALRNHKAPRPLPGVVTPHSTDPSFKTVTELCHQLYRNYLDQTADQPERNFWVEPLSIRWTAQSEAERLQSIQSVVDDNARALGLAPGEVEVIALQNEARAVLSYSAKPEGPELGPHLMKWEREAKSQLEPQLEFVMESRDDKNKRQMRNPPPAHAVTNKNKTGKSNKPLS